MRDKILFDLKEFIAFPSVSHHPWQRQSLVDCAAWLAGHLYEVGMKRVKVFPTSSYPVVYAEYSVDKDLPTVLFYGHYDVQPADPLGKWVTPPFRPVIMGDYIIGRGASDDKGQLFIHIKAVEKLLRRTQSLPVNVKFLIEGAEEIGSTGLEEFIFRQKELLHCNCILVSDTKMVAPGQPAITYSLRGSLNAELELRTMAGDLHSGIFGGYVPNAALKMCQFISGLYNKDQSISIPHFYDDVHDPSPAERAFMALNGPGEKGLLQDAAAYAHWGEARFNMYERATIRPSLSVTGLTSGYQGKGVKNVIPAVASVKLNFRLASGQEPERIRKLLEAHIFRNIPDAGIKITYSSANHPVTIPRNNYYIRAAALACEKVFGRKPKFLQNGGTIGAVDHLYSTLNVPVVLLGFARGGDNLHAPNERFYLPDFFNGIDTIKEFLQLAAFSKNKA
jgi:acetylornithine deacetylase/succinyl-diaminopimelate desuccinylase-like protein